MKTKWCSILYLSFCASQVYNI